MRNAHPFPNSIDLYFQGMAWLNKGPTPEYMAQAGGFFERALALDPGNVEALVGKAIVDIFSAGNYMTDNGDASFAKAETALTGALSLAPQHPMAHLYLGYVQGSTNRAIQGIAECERALTLDRNLAGAHGYIGLIKFFLGRAEETEGHILEALRLSPHDNLAYAWMMFVGIAKIGLGRDEEAVVWLRRSVETNRNFPLAHFYLAVSSRTRPADEARSAVGRIGAQSDLHDPPIRSTARSDDPRSAPKVGVSSKACARPGYRKDEGSAIFTLNEVRRPTERQIARSGLGSPLSGVEQQCKCEPFPRSQRPSALELGQLIVRPGMAGSRSISFEPRHRVIEPQFGLDRILHQ